MVSVAFAANFCFQEMKKRPINTKVIIRCNFYILHKQGIPNFLVLQSKTDQRWSTVPVKNCSDGLSHELTVEIVE